MAECEDRRELEGEEEEERTRSKEHNGGAGFFRLCHLGSNTCTRDERTVEGRAAVGEMQIFAKGLIGAGRLTRGWKGWQVLQASASTET